MWVRRPFNALERKALSKKAYTDSLFDMSIDYYTNIKNLTKQEIGYDAYKLVFF